MVNFEKKKQYVHFVMKLRIALDFKNYWKLMKLFVF